MSWAFPNRQGGVQMLQIINLPLTDELLNEYHSKEELISVCKKYNCDGFEVIWCNEEYKFDYPTEMTIGWHLTFYSDWFDFYNNNQKTLFHKFGSEEIWEDFYGGKNNQIMIQKYEEDLQRADKAGAKYVVFHVSDISIEECYTYDMHHSDEEIIDAAVQIINTLLDGKNYSFDFLVENLHWAGFTFTENKKTKRLLNQIHYPKKGIMLDIGHLMCTNTNLKTQKDAIQYIHKMLDTHGDLCQYIKGIHLHQSLSGKYVKENTGFLPTLPKNYYEKFKQCYSHVLKIDRHEPWTDNNIRTVIEKISPQYLVHELSGKTRADKEKALSIQTQAIKSKREVH